MIGAGRRRDEYHHGNLREALIQAAMALLAERGLAGFAIAELARIVGVSTAAPYRHFRDRNAVLAEIGRRGFEQLAANLEAARAAGGSDHVRALELCAQAHLAFAADEAPAYSAMFEAGLPAGAYPELSRARQGAFAVLRGAAREACNVAGAAGRPPAQMVALHVWSLTHGIASLYARDGEGRAALPMAPSELLEAGLLIYLRSLGMLAA